MAPDRWTRVKDLLATCLELDPERRPGFLAERCGADSELRREVESLLASYEEAGDLLEEPALKSPGDRSEDGQPADDIVGRRVGPYRIVEEIGEGGMSRVYLATRADDAFRKKVAIKLVKRGMDYEFILRRFRHERQIMASLDHPNIARLLDGGSTEEGAPYFVMEFIEGSPIDEHCDQNALSIRERLLLFQAVCSAVRYAHENRIVHRDIKPGNILITAEGIPKLLDFGIAKIFNPEFWTQSMDPTVSVLRLMTPEYASPEQVRGDAVTEATDIYSLGVLLFELLTGHRPYRLKGRAPHEMAHAICDTNPETPSHVITKVEKITRHPDGEPITVTPELVSSRRRTAPRKLRRILSGDLDNIVLMAMRKEPRRRYQSVAQLSEDIRRYLEGRPVTARKDTVAYRTGKLVLRHKTGAIALAASFAVLAGLALAGYYWLGRESNSATVIQAPEIVPFTTYPGAETQPAFSPDGHQIAFSWGGEDGRNTDIYIRRVEGGAARRLTTDPAEDLSPVWSPDGSRIAFLRLKKTETAVFVSPAEGGVHGKITDVFPNRVEAVGRHLDWSPDGRYLAVVDRESAETPFSIYLVQAADSRKQKLTTPPPRTIGDSSPAFSPDGRYLSFIRSPSSGIAELFVMALPDGEPRQVTSDERTVQSECWTPDSKAIVFSSNRTGSVGLWQIGVRSRTPRRMPGTGDNAAEPAFSRDGRYLAYSQSFLDSNVWRIPLSGPESPGQPQKLVSSTLYDSSPQFSPDGKRIAFRSTRSGWNEIWTCAADGSNPAQLTHFGGPLTGTPRWSPDGRWIAFDSRPEGQADIFVASPAGGPVRRITFETAEDVVPSWSRDGKWIYFASNRSGAWQIWKAPADGGSKIQVTQKGGFAAFESEDGRFLYYAKGRSAPGLWRVPLAGGEEVPVLERLKAGYWGYWALSGSGIYFVDTPEQGAAAGLFFLRFADQRARQLARIDKPIMLGDSAFALSPDGGTILYTQVDQSGADIMLASMYPPGR